jgi:asparagine synthase (glutamine-hydrolysing)
MCGICGLISAPADIDHVAVVARMNALLVHRGPDDHGEYHDSTTAIAMRRLAIIDVAGGHQPMANEDGSLIIVFNGEIYNYRELRSELERTGRHRFRTQSDTEVVLHAFEEFGTGTPERIEGMFALCIYRTTDHSLFFARDRFGEKPLFYWQHGETLAFSSELASLLAWDAIPRRLDREALYFYLRRAIVPAPWTTFAGVRQLPAGHWMRWSGGRLAIERYFAPTFQYDAALENEQHAREVVRETLLASVKRQMVSDVPLGAFLSGGIDSSAVVAAMQRQSGAPIKTFNVKFEQADYDESPIARRVAAHLGTDHHELVVANSGFQAEDLWRVVRHVGMPFADSSAIPTFHISRCIRDQVTVCLSGDGGDEMFAGYTSLLWNRSVDRLARWTPRRALATAGRLLSGATSAPGVRRLGKLRQLRRAVEMAQLTPATRIWALGTLFSTEDLDLLVQEDFHAPLRGWVDVWFEQELAPVGSHSRLRQMLDFRDRFSLPEDMLIKVDRMSMAASIEVRVPMLDVQMASVAARLPDRHLIRGGVTKYILRQAVGDWLPSEVFTHPKTGFSIPLHAFQNREYESLCHELLLNNRVGLVNELFHPSAVESIVRRGLAQKVNRADVSVFRATHHLWALLQLAAWAEHFRVSL